MGDGAGVGGGISWYEGTVSVRRLAKSGSGKGIVRVGCNCLGMRCEVDRGLGEDERKLGEEGKG